MTDVTLRVREDGADDERVEQLTAFLRAELQELVAVSGVPGAAPEGAKAFDMNELGTLLTTISQSTVLAALINAVSAWLGQRRERSVTVEADGDPLELTGDPTEEELALRSAWLGRHLGRHALIIASHEFADPGLASLRAPAHDAARLGEVLADPHIGAFDVRTLINPTAAEVNEAVEDFFADREPDDLLVLHFSGHGVKDEAGELHFATSGTKLSRLAGTAVSADFVARRMNRSRSRRIVLLLDCCYSGAFGRGMVARAGGSVGIEEQFGGSGRAVITASSAMEYAFEGASVADASGGEPSVFTSALVEGLETGDADRDQDGHVGLDELYDYVYDRVRRVTPHQTPGKWMLDVRGDLRIARRARPVSVPAALPAELQDAIDHSLPGVRAGAIPELRRMLTVAHEGRVLAARLALRRLADDDSRMVAGAAREALGEKPPTFSAPAAVSTPAPRSVDYSPPVDNPADADLRRPAPSAPRETLGVGTSVSPGGGHAGSIPTRPGQTVLTASGTGSAVSGSVGSRIPGTASGTASSGTASSGTASSGTASSGTASGAAPAAPPIVTALPRLTAGLALVLVVIGLVTVPGGVLGHLGDMSYYTSLFAVVWPWALAAALFALSCRDHPWLPGAALGLLAGTTGLLGGSGGTYQSLLFGIAAAAVATALAATPWWLAVAGGVLGAVGLYVIGAEGDALTGQTAGLLFLVAAIGLTVLAAYRIGRERAWLGAVAPVLLLSDAVLTLAADAPAYVHYASATGLVVVPLAATLAGGAARCAAYLVVAAGLLVRANEYVSASEPTFTTVAHVALPLAAAVAAYFSRSR
ncbi:Uncharacterized protein, contains caspase domain [Lentzea xinjiangensis]|uniref:Uncharacterized protein, contains caspase domain n=1 Tax=Lentzea xinjiangensis TaxID=402600 RepID=A0A1H9IU89_9PSEU|nr:caspase family protein [Lentzea xinjiangensis]SEQ78072.1 Uncharacterized protein, contains caspase domain [Lentzea xinjiangensis]